MELRLILMALICLCIAQMAFAVQENFSFESAAQRQRYIELSKQIRCAECQQQSLFDSNSSIASELRTQVYTMLCANKSDTEIKNYFSNRYGDYILYNPPLRLDTWLLWFGPLIMIAVAGLVLWRLIYSRPYG